MFIRLNTGSFLSRRWLCILCVSCGEFFSSQSPQSAEKRRGCGEKNAPDRGQTTQHLLKANERKNYQLSYPTGNLFIPVAHGRLEAILKEPRAHSARGVALVLHPHPLGGGTMHNKVVFRAASALSDAGLITLRINFRGVGQSSGEHDEGRGEVEDVRAGLQYLEENYRALPVTLCGFSFGARVGLEVGVSDERVSYLISIGTPVDKYDFSFLTVCRKPILFVHGANDEYGQLDRVEALVSTLEGKTDVQLSAIAGADHFFKGHLDELKRAITEWVVRQLGTAREADGSIKPGA